MKDIFVPIDLGCASEMKIVEGSDEIINARRELNSFLRQSKAQAKRDTCYYCGKSCKGFCDSHTIPAFMLRNIAVTGKSKSYNAILGIPLLKKDKGVKESGIFNLICRECDGVLFQEYENPDNYEEKPSAKMLAQIDMKNNLRNISKRLQEKELYELMKTKWQINERYMDAKVQVSDLDLEEYESAFLLAKRRAEKAAEGDYRLGFYAKLPYVVPLAFQGSVSLIFDMQGSVINNIYNYDSKYKIKAVEVCVFPLQEYSVVMMFVAKENLRYRNFFRQLNKLDLENKISVINYIIFAYTEDSFLSPNISKSILKKLKLVSSKSSELIAFADSSTSSQIEYARGIYDYKDRDTIPNLLSEKFAILKKIEE